MKYIDIRILNIFLYNFEFDRQFILNNFLSNKFIIRVSLTQLYYKN